MKILCDIFKKTGDLHHAYLLEGEKQHIRENLLHFIEKDLKHPVQGNPDFWHGTFDSFAIDDARALRDMQANKAISGLRKIFVIETRAMTVEAQNALLKVFEEPTPHTHFFIVSPSAGIFLPTLRSRVIIISEEGDTSENRLKLAQAFLKMPVAERMSYVGEIAEEKNKELALELVDGLIELLHQKQPMPHATLEELLKVRGYINDRSSSLKLLLEHSALLV